MKNGEERGTRTGQMAEQNSGGGTLTGGGEGETGTGRDPMAEAGLGGWGETRRLGGQGGWDGTCRLGK